LIIIACAVLFGYKRQNYCVILCIWWFVGDCWTFHSN